MESATELVTCSWDHTIRVWDAETATLKTELVGNKAFFDVSYSPEKKMVLAASCERTIRMYDPRSTEGKKLRKVLFFTLKDKKNRCHLRFLPSNHSILWIILEVTENYLRLDQLEIEIFEKNLLISN